ncbi:hypothetical protein [Knoellia sp. LjRoot47]|uniref:hypothetical protein n=1 Tax=Knoellia sp. LjRoot47 TaxID=3342330 RepID=UPI003ECC7690
MADNGKLLIPESDYVTVVNGDGVELAHKVPKAWVGTDLLEPGVTTKAEHEKAQKAAEAEAKAYEEAAKKAADEKAKAEAEAAKKASSGS